MSISVQCPGCGKRYKVDERFAGKKAKCQSCGAAIPVPAAAVRPPAQSDDPFAAMDELERTGTAAPEPAYSPARPTRAQQADPSPRRTGTVYDPALAQRGAAQSPRSSGASAGVKMGLAVGVGLACFVLGFWVVNLLTGGAPHRAPVAQTGTGGRASANSPASGDEHGLEATGAADMSNGLSGGRSVSARPAQVPVQAPPAVAAPPADVDVEAKPPVVFKPFAPPDPKLLAQLGDEQWIPSAPYVMKLPKDYGGQGTVVIHENNILLRAYQTAFVNVANPARQTPTSPMFTVLAQRRQNKKFPKVFTQATPATKWGLGKDDPLDKQVVFEGAKVEFGTLDGVEAVRAVGKDDAGRDSLSYVLLDKDWFVRIDVANVAPGTPDFQLLDAMVRTLHYKKPTA